MLKFNLTSDNLYYEKHERGAVHVFAQKENDRGGYKITIYHARDNF